MTTTRAHAAPQTAPDPDHDVVALLLAQHGWIRNLFDEVESAGGEKRADAFRRLVRLLAVHETAEEEVVHPYLRRAVDGGKDIVAERLAEEREAKEVLARLEELEPDDPRFMPILLSLRTSVMEHARAEERYEFVHLRRQGDTAALAAMADAVKAAEALAPTRPHPGTESAAKNIALGPVAAVWDRSRDALRTITGADATGKQQR
ncbi:hemerythrin domain-containing protein [Streptodolium elevatio]